MKDSILVKKTLSGYKLTRTLSEEFKESELSERIKKLEGELEAYTDTRDNLVENKEEILKQQSEKIDNDVKAYSVAIKNLEGNLQALKDAMVIGIGKASAIVAGDTQKGVH